MRDAICVRRRIRREILREERWEDETKKERNKIRGERSYPSVRREKIRKRYNKYVRAKGKCICKVSEMKINRIEKAASWQKR